MWLSDEGLNKASSFSSDKCLSTGIVGMAQAISIETIKKIKIMVVRVTGLFTQQIFAAYLPPGRHFPGIKNTTVNKMDQVPALIEPTF